MNDLSTYRDLRELVKDCGGIEKFRFFGHLNKYDMITPFGFALTSDSDDWVECKIEDDTSCGDLYTLAYGYKVRVVPAHDNRYASRLFYQSDLMDMIRGEYFILKTGEGDRIEDREGMEYIGYNTYLVHHWSEVVKV